MSRYFIVSADESDLHYSCYDFVDDAIDSANALICNGNAGSVRIIEQHADLMCKEIGAIGPNWVELSLDYPSDETERQNVAVTRLAYAKGKKAREKAFRILEQMGISRRSAWYKALSIKKGKPVCYSAQIQAM